MYTNPFSLFELLFGTIMHTYIGLHRLYRCSIVYVDLGAVCQHNVTFFFSSYVSLIVYMFLTMLIGHYGGLDRMVSKLAGTMMKFNTQPCCCCCCCLPEKPITWQAYITLDQLRLHVHGPMTLGQMKGVTKWSIRLNTTIIILKKVIHRCYLFTYTNTISFGR